MIKKRFFKTKDECEVTFQFSHVPADKVALVCEGNGWQPVEMKALKKGGFKTKMRLPLDSNVQFRYLLDGEIWENDEAADAYYPNQYGSENSVVVTTKA